MDDFNQAPWCALFDVVEANLTAFSNISGDPSTDRMNLMYGYAKSTIDLLTVLGKMQVPDRDVRHLERRLSYLAARPGWTNLAALVGNPGFKQLGTQLGKEVVRIHQELLIAFEQRVAALPPPPEMVTLAGGEQVPKTKLTSVLEVLNRYVAQDGCRIWLKFLRMFYENGSSPWYDLRDIMEDSWIKSGLVGEEKDEDRNLVAYPEVERIVLACVQVDGEIIAVLNPLEAASV